MSEKLPTAAEFVDTGKDSGLPAVDPKNWILDEWEDGDELVRRGDVLQEIDRRITELQEKDKSADDMLERTRKAYLARIKELEELREAVE